MGRKNRRPQDRTQGLGIPNTRIPLRIVTRDQPIDRPALQGGKWRCQCNWENKAEWSFCFSCRGSRMKNE